MRALPIQRSLWLSLMGMLVSFAAHAQCTPGTTMYYSPTSAYCGPDPNYRAPQQAPQQPVAQWERRWGAVAIDSPKAVMGVAVGKRSKREASIAAVSDCERQGGANCEIEAAYDNQCVAVITSNDSHNTPIALTVDQAIATGMKTCRDAGRTNCRVYYSACSLPVRIR